MSDKTRAAFDAAMTVHEPMARAAAALGQAPDEFDPSVHADAVAAARKHVADVDPGYEERTAGQHPASRITAPDLKAAYDEALAAFHADPSDANAGAEADRLGEQYAAVRAAARIVDTGRGRPWGVTAHAGEEA